MDPATLFSNFHIQINIAIIICEVLNDAKINLASLSIWQSGKSFNLAAVYQSQSGDDPNLVQSGARYNLANLATQPIWQSVN